jgi:cell division septum initiation protein DivIVA
MSVEQHADHVVVRPETAPEALPALGPLDRGRPNVSGDLPTIFETAPMFRRAAVGYDRFQVDTYVQWAEDELATAAREREHLVERHLRTRADLDEARRLLSHSPEGGELLQVSSRIGSMLAAAADEAERIRTEAEAHRSTATAQANRKLGYARWRIAYAEAKATGLVAQAARAAEEMAATARRLVDAAEQTRADARTEAEARLAEALAVEERAAANAQHVHQQAAEQAAAAQRQARDEIARMFSTGRDERRRADAEAAATRERLASDAATRYVSLLAEVEGLEHRRASLRAEVEQLTAELAGTSNRRRDLHVHRFLAGLRLRPRSLRAP